MTFKIEEMSALKEVQKLVESKECLMEILNRIDSEGNIIKLNGKTNEVTIVLDEKYAAFKLINVPNKVKKQDLSVTLGLNEENLVLRIYKYSLYWIVVSNKPDLNQSLEKKLKQLKFDGEQVIYDLTLGKDLRRQILKQIQHNVYLKETDELKACSSSGRKDSISLKLTDRKYSNTPSTGNTEELSWRKKSDVSNSSTKEELIYLLKINRIKANNINNYPKRVSVFDQTSNDGINRRERFNSDPQDKRKTPDNQSFINGNYSVQPEIVIDPKLVNYPLFSNIYLQNKFSSLQIHSSRNVQLL